MAHRLGVLGNGWNRKVSLYFVEKSKFKNPQPGDQIYLYGKLELDASKKFCKSSSVKAI